MANWMTPELLSKQRGIPVSTLRVWKSMGYIISSTIDNEVLLDDDSLTRYLDIHRTKELNESYLKRIIGEKQLELEVQLSQLDDELFLLKTQKQYQPLFHTLILELGKLIVNGQLREIFLAISSGEPISRVAERYQITYERALTSYQFILNNLSENTGRIATCLNREMNSLLSKYKPEDLLNSLLSDFIPLRAYAILSTEAEVTTVRELLEYTSKHDWNSLLSLHGMGKMTFSNMINALNKACFIIVDRDNSIELSPELAALVI